MAKHPNPNAPVGVHDTYSLQDDFDTVPGMFDDLPPIEIKIDGKFKLIELPDDGFILTSPGQTATVTNLDDPSKSVTFGITGSGHVTELEDGTQIWETTGRSLLSDPYVDGGEPGLVLAIGHFSWTFDSNGELIEPLHGEGQLIDVLDMIL
jgi:hypothetical protein